MWKLIIFSGVLLLIVYLVLSDWRRATPRAREIVKNLLRAAVVMALIVILIWLLGDIISEFT